MTKKNKISLKTAIFVNLNIMLGAGLFINTVELAKRAGFAGCFSYLLIGFLLLPLITCISALLVLYPGGSFYTFAQKEIGPFTGFISSWSYFTGKVASATLMTYISLSLIQQIIPSTQILPIIPIAAGIIIFFVYLNTLRMHTGSLIQTWILISKLIPILCVFGAGLILTGAVTIQTAYIRWDGIPSTLPLVLYATIGFEATCSLSSKIENSKKNAPLALFISYALVIIISFIYQFLFYTVLGNTLIQQSSYLSTFPLLINKLFPFSPSIAHNITGLVHLTIALSALGGSYAILFSNFWNLHILAEHNHLPGSSWLIQKNKHAIPFYCVIVEGLICLFYLVSTQGNQIALQQTAALGCTIAYTLSLLSLFYARMGHKTDMSLGILILGMFNCIILIVSCIYNFLSSGLAPLLNFILLFILGILLFVYKKQDKIKLVNINK